VSIKPSGGFAAAVTFTVSGLPSGATASFSPNPATASSTMTVGTGAATPPGSYARSEERRVGTVSHTTSATLAVNPAPVPDFSLPDTRSPGAGSPDACSSYVVSIKPSGGFAAAVTFSVSGLPGGATASFSPNPATASSTMTVGIGAATPPGSYALTITGVRSEERRVGSETISVSPAPVPDFSLSATPASQSVAQGAITTYAVTIAQT